MNKVKERHSTISLFLVTLTFLLVHKECLVNAQVAPGILKGTISSSTTGQPVPDVLLYLEGKRIYTTSGADGAFEIRLPEPGIYELRASCIGFRPFRSTIDASRDGMIYLELRLEEDPKEIGQVDIIGSRREWEILNTPSMEPLSIGLSTTTISADQIRQRASKTVIEALAYSPGGFIETRGRKVKQFFSVRGQKYPYPEYSINGVWQREFHETPYFFSAGNVEKRRRSPIRLILVMTEPRALPDSMPGKVC